MAAELVGGAFLSAALQVAFERLASRDVIDFFRAKKIEGSLLQQLRVKLLSVNQVLEDAEERQYKNTNVKMWLDELKHAVYEADDLLDEIATEATRQKMEAENQTAISKVWAILPPFANPFDKQIESRIQEVLNNLEFLAKEKDVLGLKQGSGSGSEVGVAGKVSDRLTAACLVADESSIYGRDGDKEKIIELLLCDDLSGNQLSVISIVGMGGLGKTTLAQLVYNDTRMEDHFQLKAWVCISEEFDVVRITKTILSALECSITGHEDLNQLQLKLKEKLTGKKFLLVFDDVWNERRASWEALQVPFLCGTSGSKILITTRNEKVALVVRSIRVHHIDLLDEEDGWKLFAKCAFGDKGACMFTNLELIGRKIVEKCKGLPLAIKTLGGLLHTKLSEQHWNKILDSEIWQLPDDGSNIMPALRLSYHYLPSNLKRCFAFCSIFPKDYDIDKEELIQMWMAEDLLHCHQENESMEELGDEFLGELESRSFLQKSIFDDKFTMHDLVNDLAKSISQGFCLRIEGGKVQNIHTKTRYFSFSGSMGDNEISLEPIYECKLLRCFVLLSQLSSSVIYDNNMGEILSRFKHLRILSLWGLQNITELDDGISNLKHLRYLDLSYTGIKRLPDSICTMYNLQTLKLAECGQFVELPLDLYKLINLRYLDLSGTKINKLPDSVCKLYSLHTLKLGGCRSLVELPPDLHNLINLRHLDLSWTNIREMPMNMGSLKHLRILTHFYVGKRSGYNIKELGKLNYLGGELKILNLENISDPMDAGEANMKDKNYLNELHLKWRGNNEDSQNERSVLKALQPHVNLKELVIENYGGTRFADWFNAPYLPNLVSLELRDCKYCFCLPPLGQLPSLKSLQISGLEGIKEIGSEFYGNNLSSAPFPSLKDLTISNMWEWEEWVHFEGECFPCLKEIRIHRCPRLRKSLPPLLPCLERLTIQQCQEFELSLLKAVTLRYLWLQDLKDSPELVSFPTEAFSAPKLETITLSGMYHLKSLHEDMHSLLPCLRSLSLFRCPQLQSVPQGGLPLSLVKFSIYDCPKLIASRREWGLDRLHSLQRFIIGDDFENVESFPEEALLPPNLTYLEFEGCSYLTTINSNGLLHLTSLQCLHISGCPNLQCLPVEGLPNSLSQLVIWRNCPLLEQRYHKENGQDWHKISHIPYVHI